MLSDWQRRLAGARLPRKRAREGISAARVVTEHFRDEMRSGSGGQSPLPAALSTVVTISAPLFSRLYPLG
jgi:hypothetical protein